MFSKHTIPQYLDSSKGVVSVKTIPIFLWLD